MASNVYCVGLSCKLMNRDETSLGVITGARNKIAIEWNKRYVKARDGDGRWTISSTP